MTLVSSIHPRFNVHYLTVKSKNFSRCCLLKLKNTSLNQRVILIAGICLSTFIIWKNSSKIKKAVSIICTSCAIAISIIFTPCVISVTKLFHCITLHKWEPVKQENPLIKLIDANDPTKKEEIKELAQQMLTDLKELEKCEDRILADNKLKLNKGLLEIRINNCKSALDSVIEGNPILNFHIPFIASYEDIIKELKQIKISNK